MSRHECEYPLRPPDADATAAELEAWLGHARTCPTHAPLLVRAEEAERETARFFDRLFETAGLARPRGELVLRRPAEPELHASTAVSLRTSRIRRRSVMAAAVAVAAGATLYFTIPGIVGRGEAPPSDAAVVARESARLGVPPPAPPSSERCSVADETAVKAAVYASQTFEMLHVYSDPAALRPEMLDRYWIRAEEGGLAAETVQKTAKRLVERKLHYGPGAVCEHFQFVSVRFFDGCTAAEVATKERWNLPLYREDGAAYRKPNVVTTAPVYWMVKRGDRWLLLKNTTPYKK